MKVPETAAEMLAVRSWPADPIGHAAGYAASRLAQFWETCAGGRSTPDKAQDIEGVIQALKLWRSSLLLALARDQTCARCQDQGYRRERVDGQLFLIRCPDCCLLFDDETAARVARAHGVPVGLTPPYRVKE